ncbi:expressed unknown protein [Seminavis robusta]|uniref:VWFA domain-containing protein n=1 Tax=Seminavis robusta TaxID=568900 RepID=A0A9N8DAQ5_9STRA|nr:expressed unknown protein [Seminavis robusta]|eukprot:Sro18_g012750.1 n/a (1932) ;mRNA; f:50843-58110
MPVHFDLPEAAPRDENDEDDTVKMMSESQHIGSTSMSQSLVGSTSIPQIPDFQFLMMSHQDGPLSRWVSRTLQRTVLKPQYYLRRQLFLSFGTTAFLAISFFILIGILTAIWSGQSVMGEARLVQEDLARYTLSTSARYVAETITKKFQNFETASDILREATRDRVVGYKRPDFITHNRSDSHVPFEDWETGQRAYPLDTPDLLQLDWQSRSNFETPQEAARHLQGRERWYNPELQVSTAYGVYFMQGDCDPMASPGDPGYYPSCTDDNNNLQTGGVVAPTRANYFLHQKAKDIVFVLKALFEAVPKAKQIGVYFANAGAGSYVKFPASMRDSRSNFSSVGCGWATNLTNPLTGRLLLAASEQARCHDVVVVNKNETTGNNTNTTVNRFPSREYNALERPWCIRQAKATPGHAVSTGPYLDAASGQGQLWIMTFGHAVYDLMSKEFIGCTLVDVSVDDLQETLDLFQLGNTSSVALIRWDEDQDITEGEAGTVISCGGQCQYDKERSEAYHITNFPQYFGIDDALFEEMQNLVDYEQVWDPKQVKSLYKETLYTKNGRLIMMYPVPYVPSEYDPNYSPNFMVVMSITEEEIYGESNDMNAVIRNDITGAIWQVSLVGLSGLIIIFLFLTWISSTLTKPLMWMQETTAQVINNAGGDDLAAGTRSTAAGMARCSPRTEVTVLLSEFEMMMDGFSGKGAAEIADSKCSEVENKFQWRETYQVLYPFNFRTGGMTVESDDDVDDRGREGTIIDTASVRTDATFLSGLTEYTIVQAITKPYTRFSNSLSETMSNVATASYTAGVEKLPGWAQRMLLKDDEDDDMPDYVVSPPKVNYGPNMRSSTSGNDDARRFVEVSSSSRVFWWVTCVIGVPMLLTASVVVSLNEVWIRDNLEIWMRDVKYSSFKLEQDAIVTATLSRAVFGEEVMARFMRDLHLVSRTAGWLLFGALNRSATLTLMRAGSEECKHYDPNDSPICPWRETEIPCDCGWNDNYASEGQCTDILEVEGVDPRYQQSYVVGGQKTDIEPTTGNRYPDLNRSIIRYPNLTAWWDAPSEMVGSYKGASASGYETTYDRVRVLSALAAISMPLYNYNPGKGETVNLGSWVGLQADGMLLGYAGCDGSTAENAFFLSSVNNNAFKIAPGLCPEGSYGYDCRCRDWFVRPNETGLYITPPYVFAGSGKVGTSAAVSIKHPDTEELIAVADVDFLPEAFTSALGPDNTIVGEGDSGFPFVITPEEDVSGGNTIFGPNYNLSQGSRHILNVTMPEDGKGTENRRKFAETVQKMEEGQTGTASFVRMYDGEEHIVFLAYAPVYVRLMRPLDHRDFAAPVNVTARLVYSLGIAVDVSDLYLRFVAVEGRVDAQLKLARGFSIAAMVVIAVSFTILTYYISLNVVRPIIALTKICKSIKDKSLRDDIPDVEGGSKEVSFVHESFQQLMKVVRFANTAFFAGDRTQSCHAMEDALALFMKLGNQKAIGVANNNLGTMVLQEQMESHGTDRLFDNSMFGICISEIYAVGISYFDEAIRHGSFEYEISKDTDDQGSYAKQLANRYFNRGMFLVVVRHHPLCPSWIQEDGVSDILRAKDLDLEVLQFLHQYEIFEEQEVDEFERILRRSRGLLSLMRNYEFQDPWGVDKLIQQAQTLLDEASFKSNLFKSMNRVGRTQQIDDLRMQRAFYQGDHYTAAKIAMRMLVEDEFVIDTCCVNASQFVSQYFKIEGIKIPTINATQYLNRETRKAQVNVLREAKNVFFCLDYSGSMAGERMERANKNLLWVYHEHCSDKDMVGFIRFNHDIDDKLWFPLGKKGNWGEVQEAVLSLATDAEGGSRLYAALNRCITLIVNGTEIKNDTWIVALTDGESSWDHPAKRVVERIKKCNKQRSSKIHVIIIGFEVPDSVVRTCELVTSATDKSLYVDARGGLDEMDKAFEQVVNICSSGLHR